MVHPERQRVLTGEDPIDLELTGRLGGKSVSELITIQGEMLLVSSAHNPNLDWVVVAVEPAEYALAPVASQNANLLGDFAELRANLLSVTLIVAGLVLAGTLVAAIVGTRLMVAPIRRLATGTEAVAAGDLEYWVHPTGYQEVDQLAKGFNKMTQDLRSSRLELEAEIAERAHYEIALEETLDELEKSQFQLIQAEKMSAVGTLVAGVAHELNNPMMGILNFAQYCSQHTSEDDHRYPVLQDIEKETKRCTAIVASLLTYSHAEQMSEESMQEGDCASLCQRAVDLLAYRIEREAVSVNQDVIAEIPKVLMHPNQIQQVFLNMLANSLDDLKESGKVGPEVNITIGFEDGVVSVTISDNGRGIDSGTLQKIFDPFFTTKPPGQGTGLGLSVSRNIIAAHGGEITCDSQVGLGTKFRITLPVVSRDS